MFTIVSGGALGVDLEAEKLAQDHGLQVDVHIPTRHPRSKSLVPLSRATLVEAIPMTQQVASRLNQSLSSPIS